MELGALGPGFPLFFILMQMLVAYLFGLTLVYFLPLYFSISESLEKLEGHGFVVDSTLAMFSYGAFVMGTQHNASSQTKMQEEQFHSDQLKNVNALGTWFLVACFYSFVAFIFMRKKLFALAEELNAKSLTPADYCIMGLGMDFEDAGNSESMLAEIKEVFDNKWNMGDKVQYINPAYDIENFYEVSAKYNNLNKEIALVEYYIESRKTETEKDSEELKSPDYNEDAYRAECDEKKQPRGFPKRKIEGKWCAKEPINIDEARNELKDVEEQIKEIET